MKRKSIAIFLAASMLVPSLSGTFVAEAVPEETELFQAAEYVTEETEFEAEETETAAGLPQVGDVVCGFETKEIRDFDIAGAKVVLFEHQKTGMKLLYVANDDVDRTFNLAFMTEAIDKTGLPHVFEHSTLDGSKKYPSRSLFFNLSYQTYNSFMNAITNPRYTTYPISSLSEEQLLRYADYYTDSCLHPMIMEDEDIYREEAWRYRMEDAAIALMEKSVFKFLPRPFVSAAVKVDFLVQNRGVRISALGYQLDIHPVKVGREILLSYEYQDLMEGTAVRYAPEIKRKKMHYGALGRLIA